ncbi:MAG: hypothetical protein M3R71_00745 [Actinomycetota bacterium]|nr:hypothetical protein [Actinomycetota bacterium]
MNSYVTGGWAATAAILMLYTWRTLRRGRTLRRSLPTPQVPSSGEEGRP